MAGSITVLPQRKSALDYMEPYLQMAFQQMMARKLAEQQYQTNLQRSRQLQPELFMPTQQVPTPQGMQQVGTTRPMPNIPTNYRFMASKAQPGTEFNATTGELSYKGQQPDFFSQYLKYKELEGGGENLGIKLPPKTIDEAKQQIATQGENPEDYEYKPVYSTGKGGLKIQTGVSAELSSELQTARIARGKEGQFITETAQDTLNTIAEIEKGISHFGLFGQLPSIPGTPRFTWEQNVNKLLSGKIVELITIMKQASKTGATGFGQLSEKEGQILKEASTALKRGLAPEKAQELLNTMKERLQKIISGNQPQLPQGFNPNEWEAVPNGQ